MYSICSSSLVTTSKLVGDISQVLWPVKTKKETHTHPISRGDEGKAKNKKCLRIFVCTVIWVLWASVPLDTSFVHHQLPVLSLLPPSLASSSFLHFHYTFCNFMPFIFWGSRTYIVQYQLPVISPPSTFLASYSFLHFHCTFCTFSAFPGKSSTKKTRKKALIRKETPEICLKQLKSATSPKTY